MLYILCRILLSLPTHYFLSLVVTYSLFFSHLPLLILGIVFARLVVCLSSCP